MATRERPAEPQLDDVIRPVNPVFAKAAIVLFCALLFLPPLVWGALQIAAPAAVETLDFDLGENRNPADFPSEFDPQAFPLQFETWFNDHAPFRSVIITAQNAIESAAERPYKNTLRPLLLSWLYPPATVGPISDDYLDLDTLFGDVGTVTNTETLREGDEDCVHSLDKVTVQQQATCMQQGVVIKSCTLCLYQVRETIDRGDHIPAATLQTVDASYEQNGYTLFRCGACGRTFKDRITEKPVDTSFFPENLFGGGTVIEGRYNWLFYTGNDSLAYYQGTNLLPEEELADALATMQELQELCDAHGKQLVFAVYPNKEQIYSEYMPTYTVAEGAKRVPQWVDYVTSRSDIRFIYPQEQLLAAKNYWQVYRKYDTHWNESGAFIGLQALYEALGKPTIDPRDLWLEESVGEIGGDLVRLGQCDPSVYHSDAVYTPQYKPNVQVTYTADSAYGDGNYICSIAVGAEDDRHIMVIGDSFRNCMQVFMERDFATCTTTHRQNLTRIAALQQAVLDCDILVLSAVERSDTAILQTARECIALLRSAQTN